MPDRMPVKEFREFGYLQELNRLFLHPLGLALEVIVDDDGSERFGEVWCMDDPEGFCFTEIDAGKVRRVRDVAEKFAITRMKSLGYIVQSPPDA